MLYIQDRKNHTLAVLENYYDDLHSKILESGVSSYKFSIAKSQKGADFLIRGNYLVLDDDNGQGWKFTIITAKETHGVVEVESEDLGLELLNKVRNSWVSPGSAKPLKYYFDKATRDTGWQIGINEISSLTRTLVWDGRDTALKRLLSIASQFDNAELEFKVEFKNLQVTKQIVNIYKKRGASRADIQLVYGDSVNDIRKTSDITELATALQGVGGTIQKDKPIEGEPDEHVTFSSLTYDDGEYFTPTGDPFLYARTANQQFNLSDNYLEDFYDFDTQSPQELLNRTLTQLKSRCEPKVNYEVDLAKVDASLNLGDTVTIVDHDYMPELLLNGRVLQLEKSYTDPSKNKVTLGNYLILYSTISDKLKKLQEQLKIIKPKTTYVWLRYAKDDQGNGMSSLPTADTKYFAMLVNKITAVPSDDPADYAEKWVLIKGEDGSNGVPGPKGEDGQTSYFHTAWADSADGTDGFYVGGGTNLLSNSRGKFKPNKSLTDNYVVYTDSAVYMTQGQQYTVHADASSGLIWTGTHMDGSINKVVLWLVDNTTANQIISDANTGTGNTFTWGYPSGTYYLRVNTYKSDNSGFVENVMLEKGTVAHPWSPAPEEAHPIYMGTYTDFMQADSLDPSAYTWSLIKGADGKDGNDGLPGKDGLGIKSTVIDYQLSSSGTVTPTGTWSTTVPALVKGQYLWTRTTLTYTDNSSEPVYSVSYVAKDGNNGTDGLAGKDGVGITSTLIEYVGAVSGTSEPTGGWSTTIPAVPAGQYLWTRTTWQYTDGTSEQGFTNALMGRTGAAGKDGSNGVPGPKGEDGQTSYFHTAWADSADGTDRFMTVYPGENLLTGTSGTLQTVTNASGWNTNLPLIYPVITTIDSDTVYTARAWLSPASYSISVQLVWQDSSGVTHYGSGNFISAGTSGYSTWTGTIAAGSTIQRFTIVFGTQQSTGSTVSYKEIKLEKGSLATPYTPSPLDDPEGAYPKFIGTYTDYIADDSTDPSKYTWAKLRGEQGQKGDQGKDGLPGKDGVGIKSTVVMYQLGSSGTTKPTGTWSATVPTLTKGQYLWTKTTWNYSDNTTEDGFSVSYIAKDGNTGANGIAGKEGVGIKTTTIAYQSGTSGTVQPTGTWVANPPSVPGGQYLWTRTVWSYTDGTSETGYSVAKAGEKGDKGEKGLQGDKGKDGVAGKDGVGIKSTLIQYASNTSGTVAPPTGWATTIPAASPGHYVWTKYTWTYTDGTTEAGYSVGKIGETGQTGQKGDTGPRGSTGATGATGAKGATGSIGPQGPKGEPGSKDVPVTTLSATQPATAKDGDIWWVLNSTDVATAMKVYTSGAWVDKKVDQSVLNIVTLNAVTINGSTINGSEFINSGTYQSSTGRGGSYEGTTDIKEGQVKLAYTRVYDPNYPTQKLDMVETIVDPSGFGQVYKPDGKIASQSVTINSGRISLCTGDYRDMDTPPLFSSLSIGDLYKNFSDSLVYLNGWGSWHDNYKAKVSRSGQSCTLWGHIKHSGSGTATNILRVPAWAIPKNDILFMAMAGDSTVATNATIALNSTGLLFVNGGVKSGNYLVFSITYVGSDI